MCFVCTFIQMRVREGVATLICMCGMRAEACVHVHAHHHVCTCACAYFWYQGVCHLCVCTCVRACARAVSRSPAFSLLMLSMTKTCFLMLSVVICQWWRVSDGWPYMHSVKPSCCSTPFCLQREAGGLEQSTASSSHADQHHEAFVIIPFSGRIFDGFHLL